MISKATNALIFQTSGYKCTLFMADCIIQHWSYSVCNYFCTYLIFLYRTLHNKIGMYCFIDQGFLSLHREGPHESSPLVFIEKDLINKEWSFGSRDYLVLISGPLKVVQRLTILSEPSRLRAAVKREYTAFPSYARTHGPPR
jgi:hypothetical protein